MVPYMQIIEQIVSPLIALLMCLNDTAKSFPLLIGDTYPQMNYNFSSARKI